MAISNIKSFFVTVCTLSLMQSCVTQNRVKHFPFWPGRAGSVSLALFSSNPKYIALIRASERKYKDQESESDYRIRLRSLANSVQAELQKNPESVEMFWLLYQISPEFRNSQDFLLTQKDIKSTTQRIRQLIVERYEYHNMTLSTVKRTPPNNLNRKILNAWKKTKEPAILGLFIDFNDTDGNASSITPCIEEFYKENMTTPDYELYKSAKSMNFSKQLFPDPKNIATDKLRVMIAVTGQKYTLFGATFDDQYTPFQVNAMAYFKKWTDKIAEEAKRRGVYRDKM